MNEQLNYFLLTKLEELKEDAEFHCKFQKLKTDQFDLISYKIVYKTLACWKMRNMRLGTGL